MGTDLNKLAPGGPELRPEWDMRLVIDVVLGTSTESILQCHDLTHHHFQQILEMPLFVAACAKMRKDLEREGATFRLKAQLQADHYLGKVHEMVMDKATDPRVVTRLIEDVVRWGGLDTPPAVGGAGGAGGFSITFQFPQGAGQNVRPHGVTIEGEAE